MWGWCRKEYREVLESWRMCRGGESCVELDLGMMGMGRRKELGVLAI